MHQIVHIEIPATDPSAAGTFFNDVFGWELQSTEGEMAYHMWVPGEGPGGGFTPLGDEIKPGDMIIYIGTDDIPGTLSKIEEHGGKVIMPETEVSTFGWMAMFTDPTGNRLALWKSKPHG